MDFNQFLEIHHKYQLGILKTEQPNPLTNGLSNLCKEFLPQAVEILQQVDQHMLSVLISNLSKIYQLHEDIQKSIQDQGRIFICGCGATGRLSLSLEVHYRKLYNNSNNVISFMAGGDTAIIKSIEDFEDSIEYAEQQLKELDFQENDLLISSTEGGETPWVIGVVNLSAKISKRKPYFLYCNPDEILVNIQRSNDVLLNERINKINLTTGQQSITGSTRMQASSILQFSIGLALFEQNLIEYQQFISESERQIQGVIDFLKISNGNISEIIQFESDAYQNGRYVLYQCNDENGITLLTDTTERSPTFSLHPFENIQDEKTTPSYVSLYIESDQYQTNQQAWNSLFQNKPMRTLDSQYWKHVESRVSQKRLLGHLINQEIIQFKRKLIYPNHLDQIKIFWNDSCIIFQCNLNQFEVFVNISSITFLQKQIILKLLMNTISTAIMGRLGRYESNVMLYVRPTNNKLIDRAIRYVIYLLKNDITYEEACKELFQQMTNLQYDESIVLKTVKALKQNKVHQN